MINEIREHIFQTRSADWARETTRKAQEDEKPEALESWLRMIESVAKDKKYSLTVGLLHDQEHLFSWLKAELELRGYKLTRKKMELCVSWENP